MKCEAKYAVWDGKEMWPCMVNATTGEPLKSMRACAQRPACPIGDGVVCVAIEPSVFVEVNDEDR